MCLPARPGRLLAIGGIAWAPRRNAQAVPPDSRRARAQMSVDRSVSDHDVRFFPELRDSTGREQ
jgi:hypothetical protein